MSRLGVVSLVSLTLVAALALQDRPRDAPTPDVRVPSALPMATTSHEAAARDGKRRVAHGEEAPATASPSVDHGSYAYEALLLAFATGGLAAALTVYRLKKVRARRGKRQALRAGENREPSAEADIVTLHDAAGNIRYASSHLLELGGYTVRELAGRRWRDLVHPDDFASVLEALRAARCSANPAPTRFRVRTRNADYVWLEARVQHAQSKSGVPQFTCRARCIATSTDGALTLLESEMPWASTNTLAADADRYSLARSIRKSFDRQEFELHYQLRVSLKNWQVTGVEALLRWNVPAGHGRTAAVIAEAERSGLIIELGEWVVRTAAQQSLRWRQTGHHYPVAVNISPLQLRDSRFVAFLRELLSHDRQLPQYLQLEVTEQALSADDNETIRTVAQLAALGFSFHIERFGAGFSKLSQLSRMPIGALKVDRPLVQGLSHDGDGAATMMSAVVALSRSLGIKVIAQGVETSDELEALRGYDFDEVQGYLLARPMTAESIEELSDINARGEKIPRK